jgi:hypothetical protein
MLTELSYGPPGHKGVTTLMSVGVDDIDTRLERNTTRGIWWGASLWLAGVILNSDRLRRVGFVSAATLATVKIISR